MTKKMMKELEKIKESYTRADTCEDILLIDEEKIMECVMKCKALYTYKRTWMHDFMSGRITIHKIINNILTTSL